MFTKYTRIMAIELVLKFYEIQKSKIEKIIEKIRRNFIISVKLNNCGGDIRKINFKIDV